jgi:hypothetical protein
MMISNPRDKYTHKWNYSKGSGACTFLGCAPARLLWVALFSGADELGDAVMMGDYAEFRGDLQWTVDNAF